MICYLDSKNDKVLKICTMEKFIEMTKSARTAMLIDAYRSGENPDAKSQLPAFVFMGYDPALLEGKPGKRQKACLQPTGLVMLDFDHIENPHEVYDTFLKSMPKLRLTLEHDLALAHITPSGKGLRLVVLIRKGKTVVEMQKAIGDAVGVECDKAVKDLSRLSFVPKYEDIFYINKSLLFDMGVKEVKEVKGVKDDSLELETSDNKGNVLNSPDSFNSLNSQKFPETYNGIPYKRIVEELIRVHGGEPQVGNRENTLFLIAGDMAKITDRSQPWLESLLPTFGLPEEEWRTTIAQVCKKPMERGLSRKLQEAIKLCKDGELQSANTENSSENLPPAMPEKLPKLVELLTSKVMPHQRAAVATIVFPALATHVNDCTFRFLDNTKAELSLMSCLFAPQSVGKSCVKPVLQEIMADIKERDTINRQRERDWQESQKNKKANEKGQTRPDDLVIRILSTDTTPAAFLGRLFAAEHGDGIHRNLCTYSQVDEIEDMYSFCQSGSRNKVQQMIKRTWDRDDIGAERWSANSANISTVLRWNWAACSTIEGGKKFFKNCLTDGTTSRVDFCTIIAPSGKFKFRYGDYDNEFRNALKPYIENLKSYTCDRDEDDRIIPTEFSHILELGERMNDYTDATAAMMPDDTWRNYAWRAVVMALKKIIVLYIANGCKWEDEFEPFAWWTFHYNMWCKMNLFYDAASAKFEEEKIASNHGHKSPLKSMNQRFTYEEFAAECKKQGYRAQPIAMLRKFKHKGVVIQQDNCWIINPEYCEKNGIPKAK